MRRCVLRDVSFDVRVGLTMVARAGVTHHHAGAHLPVGKDALRPEDERIADPAKGATVERCLTCGIPSREGSELAVFELVIVPAVPSWLARLKAALCRQRLYYRLCPECVLHANRITPHEADPLGYPVTV